MNTRRQELGLRLQQRAFGAHDAQNWETGLAPKWPQDLNLRLLRPERTPLACYVTELLDPSVG